MFIGEPEGASTWYPVNDVPYDKATYTFAITVPQARSGWPTASRHENGKTTNGWTTWFWNAPDPQASYLTMAAAGDYTLSDAKRSSGLPIVNAVDKNLTPSDAAAAKASAGPAAGDDRPSVEELRAVPVRLVRGRGRRRP